MGAVLLLLLLLLLPGGCMQARSYGVVHIWRERLDRICVLLQAPRPSDSNSSQHGDSNSQQHSITIKNLTRTATPTVCVHGAVGDPGDERRLLVLGVKTPSGRLDRVQGVGGQMVPELRRWRGVGVQLRPPRLSGNVGKEKKVRKKKRPRSNKSAPVNNKKLQSTPHVQCPRFPPEKLVLCAAQS
jgi:hypothetical protein